MDSLEYGRSPKRFLPKCSNEFDLICGVKGLIMTLSNLVVTSKVRPRMGIMSCLPLVFALVSPRWLYLVLFLQFFLFVSKKNKNKTKQKGFKICENDIHVGIRFEGK